MTNTILNRTTTALLTNKSGGSVSQGDVVVLGTTASSFTTTTTSGYATGLIGVVLDGIILPDSTGQVALGGYVPKVNLSGSATLRQTFGASGTVKTATPHSLTDGDFGQVLGTGTSPAALLWGGLPKQASGSSTAKVVQIVSNMLSTEATTTSIITWGSSAPQNTQGAEFTTVTITPTSASNVLLVEAFAHTWLTANAYMTIAIFKDTNASAVASASITTSPYWTYLMRSDYKMTAGTTSEITFKLRYGGNTATMGINTEAAMGGTRYSGIIVTEVAP